MWVVQFTNFEQLVKDTKTIRHYSLCCGTPQMMWMMALSAAIIRLQKPFREHKPFFAV
jgi:hypothetical protein